MLIRLFANKALMLAAMVAAGLFLSAVPAPPASAQEDRLVATVDGAEVNLGEIIAMIQTLPEQYQQLPLETLYPHLLERIVRMHLLAAEGRRQDLQDTPAYKQRLAAAERQLMEQSAIESMLDEKLTDELVEQRYEKFAEDFAGEMEIHARHILVEDKTAAESIIDELDGGADFESLAREKSTGPSGPNGGDLGFFGRGQMVQPFEVAAFELEAGQYTPEPVETQFGWHVIKVEEVREKTAPVFAEVADQLRAEIARELEDDYVGRLLDAADINLYDLSGNPLPE